MRNLINKLRCLPDNWFIHCMCTCSFDFSHFVLNLDICRWTLPVLRKVFCLPVGDVERLKPQITLKDAVKKIGYNLYSLSPP